MKRFHISHIILCLFLILFGGAVAYFFFKTIFIDIHYMSFVAIILYIPTLLLASVLPLYAGINLLISILRGEKQEMYPTPAVNTEDEIDEYLHFYCKNCAEAREAEKDEETIICDLDGQEKLKTDTCSYWR